MIRRNPTLFGVVRRELEPKPILKTISEGLLQRRHIRVERITCIGKESNKIEDVQSAFIHSAQEVYTEYPDVRRDQWETKIRSALNKAQPDCVAKRVGLSVRTIIYSRAERRRPQLKHHERVAGVLKELGLI